MPETTSEIRSHMRQLIIDLNAEEATIRERSAPLRVQRDALLEEQSQLNARIRAVGREIEAIEQPRLKTLSDERSVLAKMLGDRRTSDVTPKPDGAV
jgi:chromosome segregation ATPase